MSCMFSYQHCIINYLFCSLSEAYHKMFTYLGWTENCDTTDWHTYNHCVQVCCFPRIISKSNVCFNDKFCLCSHRNLSCASEKERISMRNCTRLIDSLMTYVQTQVERGESDDKVIMLSFLLHDLQALTLHGKICGHQKRCPKVGSTRFSKIHLTSKMNKCTCKMIRGN